LTASGFPTSGRAHPSVRGSPLVRSCREKNLFRVSYRVWIVMVECDPGQADMSRPHALGCSQLFAPPPDGGRASKLTGTAVSRKYTILTVTVLLSTLQLSRCQFERLFRSFASTRVLFHTFNLLSRYDPSHYYLCLKTPSVCYFSHNNSTQGSLQSLKDAINLSKY
jgi:hypothetical protein